MAIRRLPPATTESLEKLSAGAGEAAKLAGGARLAVLFALVLADFFAADLAVFLDLAAFLNVFFAALLAVFFDVFFAVFPFAPRLAIGHP
jgi:hypothetical protein